ncbi:MAG: S-layer homology domain-containing protein, partial [Clostridia bacterium]
ISSEYREDLALALELDIFGGYPDHTLRPHAPISRAEFATVLSNMADLLDIDADWEDEETGMVYVEGEILEIDEDAERISIDPVGSEDEADYNLDPDVEVWLRYGSTEQLAELDDLAAGDRVKMYYHPDGDVEYIFARAHLETVEGTLEELEMPEGDQDGEIEVLVGDEDESQDFALKEWTTLSWDHPPYPGDEVTLEVRDGLAFEVQIEPSDDFPAYFGVLHALEIDDDDEEFILTIIGEDDDELDFEGEIEEVEVSLDGEEAELENLVLGYELDLRTDGEDGFVIEIVAYTLSGTFTGEYFEYDEDAETLEIDVDGESMFFLVDGDYGPSPDDAEDWDFEENEKVEVEYDGYFLVSIGEAE